MLKREQVRQTVRSALEQASEPLDAESLAKFAQAYIGLDEQAGFDERYQGLFSEALLRYFGYPISNTPEDLDLVAKLSGVSDLSISNYETIEDELREMGLPEQEARAAAVLPFLMEAGALLAFAQRWQSSHKPANPNAPSF